MKSEQAPFKSLVEGAYTGKLRLPEFQRDWKWKRTQVIRLYDSVRKNYPIGGFLTLEASDVLDLSPRLFEGVDAAQTDIGVYVLDGQQRITAGLTLYYGTGGSHYFLDLKELWDSAVREKLDFDDRERLREFAYELDDEDKYIKGRKRSAAPENLLETDLLWTPILTDDFEFSRAKERYLRRYPDRLKFIERLVWPYFKIGSDPIVSVTELDAGMPVEAITRVFETLNTSGQRLTPIEIVVAVLFARGIHLRQELEDFRASSKYYGNMDATGEVFLQTIALLAGENPKKNTLPKTIKPEIYKEHRQDAIDHLELAGKFLSDNFGMGLDVSNRLVPYDSMLAPLGIALAKIEELYPQPSPDKAQWTRKLQRWFVGSVLAQRYIESQPATQRSDAGALLRWIEEGDKSAPDWLPSVRVRSLEKIIPSSAIGKFIACLVSRRQLKDPLNGEIVGGTSIAITSTQSHHIFPKSFCEDHIPGWDGRVDNYDLALNVMPITKETNRRWTKMDPANQIDDVRSNKGGEAELHQSYAPFFIDERCLEILATPQKTRYDFLSFIKERGNLIQQHIAQEWGFEIDSQTELEDEEEV